MSVSLLVLLTCEHFCEHKLRRLVTFPFTDEGWLWSAAVKSSQEACIQKTCRQEGCLEGCHEGG